MLYFQQMQRQFLFLGCDGIFGARWSLLSSAFGTIQFTKIILKWKILKSIKNTKRLYYKKKITHKKHDLIGARGLSHQSPANRSGLYFANFISLCRNSETLKVIAFEAQV